MLLSKNSLFNFTFHLINSGLNGTSKDSIEKQVEKEYQELWSDPKKIHRANQNLTLGWHFGYYEKGVKSHTEALINMNNYIDKLLDIKNKNLNVLDVGCGVGSTMVSLAKQHPTSAFYGITLALNEIKYAQQLKIKNNLKNTYFSLQSYNNTAFPDNFFDIIYALESTWYAEDDKIFLKEMNRILNKNGKIHIMDIFRKNDCTSPYIKKIRCKILKENNYDKPYMTIHSFIRSLKQEGFKNIKIINLSKNKNIGYFYLYCGLLYILFLWLHQQFQKKMAQKKYNSIVITEEFVKLFISYILLIIHSRINYYSISTIKK
jgi:ubiquinone/menaquinone biosynthesis C-methylase UbiE